MQAIRVPGTVDYLDALVQYVQEAAATARLNQQTTNRLRLAVEEIATNIFVHGSKEAGDERVVELGADIDDQNLRFYLEDTAILNSTEGSINTNTHMTDSEVNSFSTSGSGGAIVISAKGDITTANLNSYAYGSIVRSPGGKASGGDITLISTKGSIDTSAGILTSFTAGSSHGAEV